MLNHKLILLRILKSLIVNFSKCYVCGKWITKDVNIESKRLEQSDVYTFNVTNTGETSSFTQTSMTSVYCHQS